MNEYDAYLQMMTEESKPGIPKQPYKKTWSIVRQILKAFPKWFGLYLAFTGLITFNLFILEEAFQTCMFGGWPAAGVQEWTLVKRNIATMEKLRTTLIILNRIGGWTHPFAFVSYDGYAQAEREYIDGVTAQCFANAPELFNGEKVTFTFKPNAEEPEDGYTKFINGKITVLATKKIPPIITGIVKVTETETIVIDTR